MRDEESISLFLTFVMGVCIGVAFTAAVCGMQIEPATKVKQQAIERGYARHNPQTGVWEWIEPAKKEGAE